MNASDRVCTKKALIAAKIALDQRPLSHASLKV